MAAIAVDSKLPSPHLLELSINESLIRICFLPSRIYKDPSVSEPKETPKLSEKSVSLLFTTTFPDLSPSPFKSISKASGPSKEVIDSVKIFPE